MSVLLNTACWPNLHYFYHVINNEQVIIDLHSHYRKQSYANRCLLLSANGPLQLTVPVHKNRHHCPAGEIEIGQQERWQSMHWGAISSAYGKAPYFTYFAEEVKSVYKVNYKLLSAFNTAQLELILKILRVKKQVSFTAAYQAPQSAPGDYREFIHPKTSYLEDTSVAGILSQPYYQAFGNKFGFTPNLSILDLLFNCGLESLNYLRGQQA